MNVDKLEWHCQITDLSNIDPIILNYFPKFFSKNSSPSNFDNLTGKTFGRLTVLYRGESYIQPSGQRKSVWICQCNCNKNTIVKVRGDHLKREEIVSCGNCGNEYNLNGEYGICYLEDGSECLFDLEDYEKIKDYTWHKTGKEGYVSACVKVNDNYTKQIKMHRLIMNAPDNMEIDHIYHNVLDNRKSKLRIATRSQNRMNRRVASNNTSGVTGVYYCKNAHKWRACISKDKKPVSLGCFANIEDAIAVRKKAEQEMFGQFAYKKGEKNI